MPYVGVRQVVRAVISPQQLLVGVLLRSKVVLYPVFDRLVELPLGIVIRLLAGTADVLNEGSEIWIEKSARHLSSNMVYHMTRPGAECLALSPAGHLFWEAALSRQ